MKKLKLLVALALLSFLSSFTATAQSGNQEWLGVWCTIDVDLANDNPTDWKGYATYSFPCPPEGVGSQVYGIGPGRPYITNNVGTTELHLDLRNLEMEVNVMAEEQHNTTGYVETTVEFPVLKSSYGTPYYYSIILNVKLRN